MYKTMTVLVIVLVSFIGITLSKAQVEQFTPLDEGLEDATPAFPGAEGFGRYARGGRGGDVYYVTNLNDSGSGSLRHGIESANGPRTIIFNVSGTIYLNSRIRANNPGLTIAGQTAPGDGITLANYDLWIEADDVIVRYIRVRPGDSGDDIQSGLRVHSGANIIIDHCSVSWGGNETLSTSSAVYDSVPDIDLVTIQWCMITEGLYKATNRPTNRGRAYGGVIRSRRESLHHNLYAHHNWRTPRISWRSHIKADFRNNVIYNWGTASCFDGSLAYVNWANNYYKAGPAYRPGREFHQNAPYRIFTIWHQPGVDPNIWSVPEEDAKKRGKFYIEGNYVVGYPEISSDNWAGGVAFDRGGTPDMRVLEPHNYPKISYERSAQQAYEVVLERAGASLARDSMDSRIVDEVREGTATYGGVYGAGTGIIDSHEDVGGWPELNSTEPPVDSDGDGMPDWWKAEHGLEIGDPGQGNRDRNGDGYTNLEEYLNWLVEPNGRFLDRYPHSPPYQLSEKG